MITGQAANSYEGVGKVIAEDRIKTIKEFIGDTSPVDFLKFTLWTLVDKANKDGDVDIHNIIEILSGILLCLEEKENIK